MKLVARVLNVFRPHSEEKKTIRTIAREQRSRALTDIREFLLLHTLESLRTRLAEAGVAMDVKLPQHPVPVLLDHVGLHEVFSQIGDLACRVMPAGGTLKLLARVDGAHAVVNFMDNGSAKEPQLGRCFTAAFSSDLPRSHHDHLDSIARVALCERIVSDHRGRIYAAPSPLGSLGITLRLPLC